MTLVTRFAPSPTGLLHIGGARTALFNWLAARHGGGTFMLRIEDTDAKRSTPDAIEKIVDGLRWLGLDWDGDEIYQSANRQRHVEIAQGLLASGHAYHCYCTPDELRTMREEARAAGRPTLYDGRWRDRDAADAPAGVKPTIRIKMPRQGETVIGDLVQGNVTVPNQQLDDFILLRADGTPTYMLAVVVDDHDMGVTRIIRGDDHLNNAFRQYHLFEACGWDIPEFAHIPLIHGPDGAKLSKRHGALGVESYREMGYLPAAIRNYLLRLGWSHGDDEIIATEQAISWFGLANVNKSAARFDFAKLDSLNAHYIKEMDNETLLAANTEFMIVKTGVTPDPQTIARIRLGLNSLKERVHSLVELTDASMIYCPGPPSDISEKAKNLLDSVAISRLSDLADEFTDTDPWDETAIEARLRAFCEAADIKLGKIAQPLRAALTGSTASPGIFEVMAILGKDLVIERIRYWVNRSHKAGI